MAGQGFGGQEDNRICHNIEEIPSRIKKCIRVGRDGKINLHTSNVGNYVDVSTLDDNLI